MTIKTLAGRCDVVKNPDDLERVRWFQIHRYHDAGLLDQVPASLPADPLVAKSVYFAAYSPDGEIWGTSRLIEAANEALPVMRDHKIGDEYRDLIEREQSHVSEISRFAVSRDAPQVQTFAALGREMWQYCASTNRSTIWLGSIGIPMMRMLDQVLDIPFEVMGPVVRDYYNEDSYPVLIDTVRYMADRRGTRLWKFLTDGLTIDLTGPEREPLIVEEQRPDLRLLRAS